MTNAGQVQAVLHVSLIRSPERSELADLLGLRADAMKASWKNNFAWTD
jgi:hypothetical protein